MPRRTDDTLGHHRIAARAVRTVRAAELQDVMALVDAIYKWISRDVSPEANRVLGAALRNADDEYAERIGDILIERRHETAWQGLAAGYGRLSPAQKLRMHNQPQLLRAGIHGALKSRRPSDRRNALLALLDHPRPQVLYLVADVLRDPNDSLRDLAVRILRRSARQILADSKPTAKRDVSAEQLARERADLVVALRESLRTFDVHRRGRMVEACLWFAKELDQALWDALSAANSSCAYVVDQNLKKWDHPRLAGFIVLCLAHAAWRRRALAMLQSWTALPQIVAVLRQVDLLDNPEVRRGLHAFRPVAWLKAVGMGLGKLPPDARAQVPFWIRHLGFSDGERLRYLSIWQTSSDRRVQRAAVYALAAMNSHEAVNILSDVALQPGPLNRFARWYMHGRMLMNRRRRVKKAAGAGETTRTTNARRRTSAAPARRSAGSPRAPK